MKVICYYPEIKRECF